MSDEDRTESWLRGIYGALSEDADRQAQEALDDQASLEKFSAWLDQASAEEQAGTTATAASSKTPQTGSRTHRTKAHGRVDETGAVYVRTADGEQVVGSWQAGTPEEALAYFERKYEGLVVEIGLLEKRVKTTDLSAKDAQTAIDHIREQVDAHHVVGDLAALRIRLDKLVETVDKRREERKQQRAKQSDEA
ncbi:hypothetical protein ABZ445_38995, partial [Streptomyces chartreusis]